MARMTLEELVRQLVLVYGDGLRCVAVYGSAARGEQIAKRSDVNVFVIVDAIDMDHLRREAAVARAWREAGNPPPLTLTLAEWRGSADIFPMEYADILAYHRVLHGAVPVEGVAVRLPELRLQLEHEVRSKLLRLRHAVLSSGAEPRAMSALLEESASAMLVLLRAVLRLAGEEPPTDSLAVIDRVRARTGLEVDMFARAVRHARGVARLDAAAATRTVEEYLAGVAALAVWVDEHGAGRDAGGPGHRP
jgi:hypothetical protein